MVSIRRLKSEEKEFRKKLSLKEQSLLSELIKFFCLPTRLPNEIPFNTFYEWATKDYFCLKIIIDKLKFLDFCFLCLDFTPKCDRFLKCLFVRIGGILKNNILMEALTAMCSLGLVGAGFN